MQRDDLPPHGGNAGRTWRLYDIMGLPRAASREDVRRAYRSLALRMHPDKARGDERAAHAFREVNAAYALLSDDRERCRYDAEGDQGLHRLPTTPTASASASAFAHAGDPHARFSEFMFRTFFAGDVHAAAASRARHKRRHLPSAEACVLVDAAKLGRGVDECVQVNVPEHCQECEGSGVHDPAMRTRPCSVCAGRGTTVRRAGLLVTFETQCTACEGTGVSWTVPTPDIACPACTGAGICAHLRTLRVRLPPGVADGHTYVVRKDGCADVQLRVRHTPECRAYRIDRASGDVHITVPVHLREVLTGFERPVNIFGATHVVGNVLPSPRYTNPTRPVVLPGRGLPPRGSFVVHFDVIWPDDDAARQPSTAANLRKYADVVNKIVLLPEEGDAKST